MYFAGLLVTLAALLFGIAVYIFASWRKDY